MNDVFETLKIIAYLLALFILVSTAIGFVEIMFFSETSPILVATNGC